MSLPLPLPRPRPRPLPRPLTVTLTFTLPLPLPLTRAALIVVQDTRVAQSVIMKLAGGSTDARYKDQLNVDAFVAQAAAYDEVAAASRTGRMVSSK